MLYYVYMPYSSVELIFKTYFTWARSSPAPYTRERKEKKCFWRGIEIDARKHLQHQSQLPADCHSSYSRRVLLPKRLMIIYGVPRPRYRERPRRSWPCWPWSVGPTRSYSRRCRGCCRGHCPGSHLSRSLDWGCCTGGPESQTLKSPIRRSWFTARHW